MKLWVMGSKERIWKLSLDVFKLRETGMLEGQVVGGGIRTWVPEVEELGIFVWSQRRDSI